MKNCLLFLCLFMLMGAGLISIAIFQRNVTPQVAILQGEIARLQSERALDAARLSAALQRTGIYVGSRLTGLAVLNLWPVWMLSAGLTLAIANRARWTKQVAFRFDSIETMIPASRAVPLIEKCVQTIELRHSGEILAYEEAISQKRIAQDIHAIRALKSMVKAEPEEPKTPIMAAIPARSATYHLRDLWESGDLASGHVALGRNAETGNIAQARIKDMCAVDVIGRQNHGKTNILKMLIAGGFRLQKEGANVRLYLIDPHGASNILAARNDSVKNFFAAQIDRFDAVIDGAGCDAGAHVKLIDGVIDTLSARRDTGETTPTLCIYIDELGDLLDDETHGKTLYKQLRKLRKWRKFGCFTVCVWHDATKEGANGVGTALQALNVTAFAVNSTESKARTFLGADAAMASNLPVGTAALRLSGQDTILITLPHVTSEDLTPFVSAATSETPVDAAIDTTPTDTVLTPETLTPDMIRLRREELAMKQSDLGKVIGVTQKDVSRIERNEKPLTNEIRASLFAALFAPEKSNIIPFVKRA